VEEWKSLGTGDGAPWAGGGQRDAGAAPLGRLLQVDPIKPAFKAPGSRLLKLKYGKPLSIFAFRFNLRRYTLALEDAFVNQQDGTVGRCMSALA